MRALVIADDLTGATDAGSQCARRGIRCLVVADHEGLHSCATLDADVLVVNTESRHAEPTVAAERIGRVARWARERNAQRLFKKTDSTLRGNLGAELSALVQATGVPRLCFAPAYPAAGRTVRDGRHYVEGRLVHESPFGFDLRSPVRESHVPTLLSRQTSSRVLSTRRDALREALRCSDAGPLIIVVDAESEDDMRAIAAAAHAAEEHCLAAGPAGFLDALLPLWALPGGHRPELPQPAPMLAISGSMNRVSLRQVRHGLAHGFVGVRVEPAELFGDPLGGDAAAGAVTDTLLSGRNVLLHTVLRREEEKEHIEYAVRAGVPRDNVHLRAAQSLGGVAATVHAVVRDAGGVLCLVLFGGDTAYAVLSALDCRLLEPLAEVERGVNLSRAPGFSSLAAVVTKSGGFGSVAILNTICRFTSAGDSTSRKRRTTSCSSE